MKKLFTFLLLTITSIFVFAQSNINGTLDDISDLSTKQTVMFTMEDGVKLATDIFLPVTQDSISIMVDLPGAGETPVQVIPKGVQYLIYDSINGEVNPNPYQLPILFTRTPYNKQSSSSYGGVVSILGYSYAMQDMRGCFESEGVYLPMFSDSWKKTPYYSNLKHLLDLREITDPKCANNHEDGYQSIVFLSDSLMRAYDFNADGNIDTFLISNGSVGMFGASALGNSQYTAAAARKIDPEVRGLKSLFPIVASVDQYGCTEFQNGVYRYAIVNNWIKKQINNVNDASLNGTDNSLDNNLHSFTDYGLTHTLEASEICLSSMIDSSINGNLPGYYPNSPFRAGIDATPAPVNQFGEGDPNGTYSRYSNLDVPIYHLTGWWDIFVDGQINTFNKVRNNINDDHGNKSMQKLIIGPWAHETVTSRTTGDVTYPENVTDIVKLDISTIDNSLLEANIFESEVYKWFRHTLNEKQGLGDPKFIIPESQEWQVLNEQYSVRIPSEDYIIPYSEFIAFLGGLQGLNNVPFEISINGEVSQASYDVPPIEEPFINIEEAPENGTNEYFQHTEDVRFYVAGPVDDGVPENALKGNYWFKTDSFPFVNDITYTNYYLHSNQVLNLEAPQTDEGSLYFIHDPDNPVSTVGGANMTINTPDDSRDSQGQMDLTSPDVIDQTMNNPGVISFTSDAIQDSVCIIGFPKATLHASSSIAGLEEVPTNTDFFVRVLDVYPDGRELFVVEGAVNARAREYARSIFEGNENPNAEFSNIISDTYYEYEFLMMPIAYTFGHQHKIKVLISSGNYPRYMSNANLPLNDGEFFRRKPNDGKTYKFNNITMLPRVCTNNVAFAPDKKSFISFPVYVNTSVDVEQTNNNIKHSIDIYPNPTTGLLKIKGKNIELITITDLTGKTIIEKSINSNFARLDISNFSKGIYLVKVKTENEIKVEKIILTDIRH